MAWNFTPEERFQIAVCKYLRVALPSGAVVRSIDHGVKMNESRRIKLHARGVRGGLPDMMIWWNGRHAQIELKVGTPQSAAQKDFQVLMEAQGFPYAICRSLEDVEAALRCWGWPVGASVVPVLTLTAPPKKKRASRPREPRQKSTVAARRFADAFNRR